MIRVLTKLLVHNHSDDEELQAMFGGDEDDEDDDEDDEDDDEDPNAEIDLEADEPPKKKAKK